MIDRIDPCLHLFLSSKLKDIKNHPYCGSMFSKDQKTTLAYVRMCILGLIMCNIKHDLLDKIKFCLEYVAFTECFPTDSTRVSILQKCIQYKKISIAEYIVLNTKDYFVTLEESLQLGTDGYVLYVISELKRLNIKQAEDIPLKDEKEYTLVSESDFEIDTACFSIFREIEDKLNRTFLQDCILHSLDPKSYLSTILKRDGIRGITPYLESELSQDVIKLIRDYTREPNLETIIEEDEL